MANHQIKVKEFVDSIKPLSLFGGVDENNVESAESERREREKKAKIQRKQREEEIQREEQLKRQQEYEDYKLALKEQERWDKSSPRKFSHNTRHCGVGRANDFASRQMTIMKGRGQPLQLMQDETPSAVLFKKEQHIKSQICQKDGLEGVHSNTFQLQVWQGHRTPEQPSPASDSSKSEDQFEDANSHFSQSSQSSSSPFQNVTSSESGSPIVKSESGSNCAPNFTAEAFPALPSPRPVPIKTTRKPRCAAKFTNPLEVEVQQASIVDNFSTLSELRDETGTAANTVDSEEDFDLPPQDPLAVLGSLARPLVPPRIRMSSRGVSINDLRASKRIIDPQVLNSDGLLKNLFSKTDNNFMFNKSEFPPL